MGLGRECLGFLHFFPDSWKCSMWWGLLGSEIAWCIGSCQLPFLQAEVNGICTMVGVDDNGETICRVAGYLAFVPSYRFW